MKSKFWCTKNNYAAKTLYNKENISSKDTLMLGQKATLYANLRQHNLSMGKNQPAQTNKQSSFEQLKRQIKFLQNSQFLGLQNRCKTEPDQIQEIQFKITGKEFMPSKKINQLQKFKLYLKRKGKARRISQLLDKKRFQQGKDYNCLNYLQAKDINCKIKEHSLKKKETPSIVKKYYRPQTSKIRSQVDLTIKQNSVRGRSLKSSATNRIQKQNVLIYCY